jgi:hypothetical protein
LWEVRPCPRCADTWRSHGETTGRGTRSSSGRRFAKAPRRPYRSRAGAGNAAGQACCSSERPARPRPPWLPHLGEIRRSGHRTAQQPRHALHWRGASPARVAPRVNIHTTKKIGEGSQGPRDHGLWVTLADQAMNEREGGVGAVNPPRQEGPESVAPLGAPGGTPSGAPANTSVTATIPRACTHAIDRARAVAIPTPARRGGSLVSTPQGTVRSTVPPSTAVRILT